jgi:hypothetical protein
MKNTKSITAVTYILVGSLLNTYYSLGEGLYVFLISLFGLILFFMGLNSLKYYLDDIGKDGVSKLIIATVLSILAAFFGYFPIIGFIPAAICGLASFILQIMGLIKLRQSAYIGSTGAAGANYLLVAMGIMVFASLFNILPFIGSGIKSVFVFIAFLIIPFGWIKIQEGIILNNKE